MLYNFNVKGNVFRQKDRSRLYPKKKEMDLSTTKAIRNTKYI